MVDGPYMVLQAIHFGLPWVCNGDFVLFSLWGGFGGKSGIALPKVLSTWNFEVLGHQLTVSDIKALDMCPADRSSAGEMMTCLSSYNSRP